MPDIRGVACFPRPSSSPAVSIKQRYPGHAKQAGVIAAQCGAGAYLGRYIVVVDDGIDPYAYERRALGHAHRSDPANDSRLDPPRLEAVPSIRRIPKDKRGFSTRAYHRRDAALRMDQALSDSPRGSSAEVKEAGGKGDPGSFFRNEGASSPIAPSKSKK